MTEVRNVDAALFDLDGTLIDSMWMWKDIDIEYLGGFGIEFPEDLQASISGMSFSETAVYFKERFGIKDSLDEIKKAWNDMAYYKYTHEVPLKPGVLDFLKDLRSKGIRTGIATSNSRELVDAVIEALHLEDYFDTVVTACEAGKGKPAPDIYLIAAERLECRPDRCVVFEDICEGLQAGINAGMRTCAVSDAFSANEQAAKETMSDFCIDSYDDMRLFRA